MFSHIPDSLADNLTDPLNRAYYQITQEKRADTQIESAKVISYDVKTHTVEVRLDRAGYGSPIRVKIQEHFQGKVPGTGHAHAFYVGEPVDVAFLSGGATGLYNSGTVVGVRYHHKDGHAPAYAPWLQAASGTVVVHETADGKWGNAEHVDDNSNISRTTVAKTNVEDWGNEHNVVNGPNITRSEELTRRSATGVKTAASKLS